MSRLTNGRHAARDSWYQVHGDDERQLFARFAVDRDPAAREAIVELFIPLARQLARRYRNFDDLEDLEQIAAIGLLKAIDRFDPARGLAFSSFAFPTILGELKRHLRDRGWSIRPPRELQVLATRVEHHAREIVAERGRSPTVAELAQRAGRSVEDVLEAMQAATARHSMSLDHLRRDAEDAEGHGMDIAIEDTGFATAEDAVLLGSLMRVLTERERQILNLRFREDLTQSQIGTIVGLSQMNVSRMIRRAIEQLQSATGPASSMTTSP